MDSIETSRHSFSAAVAERHGLHEAIILSDLAAEIEENSSNHLCFHDGRYWTYNSVNAYVEKFPYMSRSSIRCALESLEEQGLIFSGNYNEDRRDRTKWYALSDYGCDIACGRRLSSPKHAKSRQ